MYPGKLLVETIDKAIVYTIACTQIHYAIIYSEYHFYALLLFWCCFIYAVYNYCFKRQFIINQHQKSKNKAITRAKKKIQRQRQGQEHGHGHGKTTRDATQSCIISHCLYLKPDISTRYIHK